MGEDFRLSVHIFTILLHVFHYVNRENFMFLCPTAFSRDADQEVSDHVYPVAIKYRSHSVLHLYHFIDNCWILYFIALIVYLIINSSYSRVFLLSYTFICFCYVGRRYDCIKIQILHVV